MRLVRGAVMRSGALAVSTLISLLLQLPLSVPASAQTSSDWFTYHRDSARTGSDPNEPQTASAPLLGWVSDALDGDIYAEPLVVGGRVFIATENNTVYALDTATGRLAAGWAAPVHIGTPVPASALGGPLCSAIDPVGITSTPVIDPVNGVLYTVALVQAPIRYVFTAINLSDGSIRFQRPIDPPGLDAVKQLQRGALALTQGKVHIPFGGRGDCLPYNGWVVSASATSSSDPLESYLVQTDGVPAQGAAIWAPSGITVDDAGFLYVATGNGNSMTFDRGNSVIRLALNPLREDSFFTPSNWSYLSDKDLDLGSVAPTLVNDGLIFQVGKEGIGYLLGANALPGIGNELFSAQVCPNGAYGGTAYAAPYVFVSCQTAGVARVTVDTVGLQFTVDWWAGDTGSDPAVGPPVVAAGVVWAVETATVARLHAYSIDTGIDVFEPISLTPFGTPVHFNSLATANGQLFLATGTRVEAFLLQG